MAVTSKSISGRRRRYKINLTYADLSTAATTNNISLGLTLPARAQVVGAWMKVTTNFLGGGITAYTLGLGVGSAELVTATSAFSGTPLIVAYGSNMDNEAYVKSVSATTDLRIYAVSTTANLNAATQGVVDIYIIVEEFDE